MKASIDVKDRKEADAIRSALEDPATRAFVLVMGALQPLSARARTRVLNFVADHLAEKADQE